MSGYPPEIHVIRDLRPYTERDAQGSRSYLEVVSEARAPAGSLRAGVLATLVDMAGGEAAVNAARPNWVATSDLVLHVTRPVREGLVCGRASILRTTRSTIVLEVDLSVGDDPVGLATMTFAVLTARTEVQRMGTGTDEPRTDFGRPGSHLATHIDEALGLRVVDAASGAIEIDLTPYVVNSLGALQGGVVAIALEVGAETLGRHLFGADVTVLDFSINYLSLMKAGPARTVARVLRRGENEALVRVELHDTGHENRLCTVATALVAVS
jgi:uncharacterized protein (TIGR00369 family)